MIRRIPRQTHDLFLPMKTPALISSIGLALLAAAPVSHAAITAYVVDFTGEFSLEDNFQKGGGGDVVGAAWSATSGVGAGGGISITNTGQNNFYYRPDGDSSFDFAGLSAGQGFRSAADFRWSDSTATELTVLNLGFAISNTAANALSATGSIGGSIIRNTTAGITTTLIRLRAGNSTIHSLEFDQAALTDENWYRLTFETLKSETAGTFNSIVTLYSIGADGLSAPVLFNDGTTNIVLLGDLAGAGLYSDTSVSSVYDIRNTNGIDSVDNLNVTMIPEPASAALLGLGAVVFGLRRRR